MVQLDGWVGCSVDVVGMICAIINGLVQNSNSDVMLASCLHILGSFALW
jgi:hypothetical protein